MWEQGEDGWKNGEFAYIMGCRFLMRPTLPHFAFSLLTTPCTAVLYHLHSWDILGSCSILVWIHNQCWSVSIVTSPFHFFFMQISLPLSLDTLTMKFSHHFMTLDLHNSFWPHHSLVLTPSQALSHDFIDLLSCQHLTLLVWCTTWQHISLDKRRTYHQK